MSPRFGGGRGGGAGDEGPRSAEAREQARREREARRAAREGRAPSELPPLEYEDAALASEPARPEPAVSAEPPSSAGEVWATDLPHDSHPGPAEFAHGPDHADAPFAGDRPPAPAGVPAPSPADDGDAWADDDEPFSHDDAPLTAAGPTPDAPPPAPAPAPPAIPPRPALSWEKDEPTRVDPPAEPVRPATPPARPDIDFGFDDTGDEPAVRVLGHDDDDRPVGVKRVAASTFATAAGADGPPRFGAPPKGRGRPGHRRGMRRVGPALVILVLLVIAYGANKVWQPFHGDGSGSVRVVIPMGSGARQIGDQLADAGVVDSGLIFSLRARLAGDRDKLRSGPHTLKKDMSYGDAIKALTVAPKEAPTVDVAIPEGLTIKQVGSIAHRAKLSGSYRKTAVKNDVIQAIRGLGAPTRVKTPEGFLFPATYRLRTTASVGDLIRQQLKTFDRETAKIDYAYAKSKNLTRYDVLIIASLIENEAQTAKDRPLIAAVIYNRLKQGIPLQIDATTRYETGNYGADARPIRQSELDADTPYNTRIRKGLPPTPISSPGLASLRAAAKPAKKPYLYYVVKPCGNGAHAFSASDQQFAKDKAAYDAKRAELGGKDPSSC